MRNIKQIITSVFLVLAVTITYSGLYGQESNRNTRQISGSVKDDYGQLIEGAHIIVKASSQQTYTTAEGNFSLTVEGKGHVLVISKVGYETVERNIQDLPSNGKLDIVLSRAKYTEIEETTVIGKSALQEVRETAYNVTALDAKAFHNTTLDLAHLLNRASGVKIRETGGVGSDYSINLNGFTGRHVKVFIDGIPMEGMGSAFQLNNIPVNLAERIEIYKGVVPIELGADALGGAINIITNKRNKSYADVSYSYGSFNTHRTNLNLGFSGKKGFTFQLNAIQNYSDNNYKVLTQNWNPEDRTFTRDSVWVRRFHDSYRNESLSLKAGFVNTKFADQLLIGLTLGQEYADIQHSNLMKIVFGAKRRTGNTLMPSVSYAKRDLFLEGLNVKANVNYNRNYNQNIDTSTFEYDWYGKAYAKKSGAIGEGTSTLAEFFNNNASFTFNADYQISDKHSISFNEVWTSYSRENADKQAIKDETDIQDNRASNYKNIVGVSYKYNFNKEWVTTVFGKHYRQSVTGPVNVGSIDWPSYEQGTNSSNSLGYGLATTYFFNHSQVKLSLEKAVRMPTERELLGDQLFERANSELRPESSHNINLGYAYQKDFNDDHAVFVDVSGIYRDVKDFIQRSITSRAGEGVSMNHGRVQNLGVNFEGRYYFRKLLTLGGTLTYQSLINKEKYEQNGNQLSVVYNDRMPNQPYLFGNGEAELRFADLFNKSDLFSFAYSLNYVHSFFLRWESLGSSSTKYTVDEQLSHDLIASYAMKNGRYNVSFEARNITDQRLYDNFSLQKPGRSFYLKLRYFFM